ncbi:unnamed protein product [Moneuplotes crassus]|uniref:Uncharacterized protein n=1 Tax=Euplotes crassus TaxID=5936 RepID=A0AAD1UJN3_EUPCR|nr:unnamed protein product [Moneuplotes crassus]
MNPSVQDNNFSSLSLADTLKINAPLEKKNNLYKYLQKNKDTLTELSLDNCKEDLVHLFGQFEFPLLTKFELSEFVAIEDAKGSKKSKSKQLYGEIDESPMTKIPLDRFPGLVELKIVNSPNITNGIFGVIAKHCPLLTWLEFGGKPEEYNCNISLDGIRVLEGCVLGCVFCCRRSPSCCHGAPIEPIETLKIHYCVKIGEKSIELINERFCDSLKSFSIYRNYLEFSAKITDKCLKAFEKSTKLETLEVVYCRNFDWDCVSNIATCCKNLKVLNLQDCPIQESFEPLAEGCPYLEELNMSGDSWVKEEALVGLCKHKNLKIYHLGHFEHGDVDCLDIDEPEKGKFIGTLLSCEDNLPNLQVLHLEKCCLSMYIEDRIKNKRPDVEIAVSDVFPTKISKDLD